ncbi:MAG: thioredoxin family protein [Kaiparowitsia implicata GSE-PSE-MK54-09C]|nr:thioredoxin family protein [Kaiparowitsia implicata GSE-PSE-MK54-09C]
MTQVGQVGTAIGSYAPDFELPGVNGTVHHLRRYLGSHRAIAVVFISNRCPLVAQYLERLRQIQAEIEVQEATLIGINANDETQHPEEGFEPMQAFAAQHQLNFPYLRDVTQDVAEAFGAVCTPHAFLLDGEGVLRYSGAIDDNPQPAAVTQAYLKGAIAQLLRGNPPQPATTKAIGSALVWKP